VPWMRSREEIEAMYAAYTSGLSLGAVAKQFGIARQNVYEHFAKRGLQCRPRQFLPFVLYRGRKFTKNHGGYYYATKRRGVAERMLHRVIWVDHYGTIPPGYDIHHRNEIKDDNRIENLELKTRSRHVAEHKNSSKAVRRLDTMEIFPSGVEAARRCGFNRSAVSRAIIESRELGGTKWEFV